MKYKPVLIWHATLCQTMEYSTIFTLTQPLYDVVVSMHFEDDPKFEFILDQFLKWMEPFEFFKDIENNVFQMLY